MTAASMGDVLHERDAELTALIGALDDAIAGAGRAVLIEGSPGIGKTRLLDELCRAAGDRARLLRARGGEQERELSMLATRELFTPLVAGATADELDCYFAGAAALAQPAVDLTSAAAPAPDSDFALIHGLYWLVANLADRRPLLLAVDDAHWVDEPTQRWLAYLLPRVAELPVVLALTVRPRELSPASPLAVGISTTVDLVTVRPAALSPAAGALLVRATLPSADDEFCHAAHRSTGGNPLLLHNLVKAVSEAGLAPTADGARRLDDIGSMGLGRIILPRLHRLGRDCISLARAVAILGDGCTTELARSLAELDPEAGLSALDRLIGAEILSPPHVGDSGIGFTHPLVRAVITDDLAPGVRQDLHRRAAKLLVDTGADAERAARHLVSAEAPSEPWAKDTLRAAAHLASTRGAPAAALAHTTALLATETRPAGRAGLLLEAGAYAFRAADPRGLTWLEEALTAAGDPATAALAWSALTNWRLILGGRNDPRTVLKGLPHHHELDPELQLAVRAQFMLDVGFTGAGLRKQLDRYPEPAEIPQESAVAHLYLCAKALDVSFRGGTAQRTVELARQVDLDLLFASAADTLGAAALCTALAGVGELDWATRISQRILEHASRTGSIIISEGATTLLAYLFIERGEIAQAESLTTTWLQMVTDFVTPTSKASAVGVWVVVQCERGRLQAAEEALARWSDIDAEPPEHWHGAQFRHRRAHFRRIKGDAAGAIEDDRAVARILEQFDALNSPATPWRLGLAQSLSTLGNTDEARDLAEEQLDIAREIGAAPLLGRSLRTLGTLRGATTGRELVAEAVDVLDGSGAQGEHTRALLALGRLLRLDRGPATAREPLQQALDLADRCGALLLAREVEDELRLAGARPRRRAVTGVHALTPAELRVATLAAQGMSNPEIAQSLFVTRKTVEKHLGAAFLKLHISSRDQLHAVLERQGS